MKLHQHLLSEAEQMATGGDARKGGKGTASSSESPNPRLRGLTTPTASPSERPPKNPQAKPKACKFFTSESGCMKGQECKFGHEFKELPDKKDRCWKCGSKKHRAAACTAGQSPTSPTAKAGPPKDPLPKGQPALRGQATSSSSVPPSPCEPPGLTGGETSATATSAPAPIAAASATTTSSSSIPMTAQPKASNPTLQSLTNLEPQELLRMLRLQEQIDELRRLQAISLEEEPLDEFRRTHLMALKEAEPLKERFALLDSGATHAYRGAQEGELDWARTVKVNLAGGQSKELKQNPGGTLLGEEGSDAILPLGKLVRLLNCEVHWNPRSLVIKHPEFGKLRVRVRNDCPEVVETEGLRIISELEQKRLLSFTAAMDAFEEQVAAMEVGLDQSWERWMNVFLKTGSRVSCTGLLQTLPFLNDMPMSLIGKIAEEVPVTDKDGWKLLKKFPWNRSRRKQLWASRRWVVHVYAGKTRPQDDISKLEGHHGMVVISIDLEDSRSFNMDEQGSIFQLLMWAALSGRLEEILGGPPCRTASILRHKLDDGPKPLRSFENFLGIAGLSDKDQAKVDLDTRLIVRMMVLFTVAQRSRHSSWIARPSWTRPPGTGFLLEHPASPRTYLKENHPLYHVAPSVWDSDFMKKFLEFAGLSMYTFDQGCLGHQAVKPTTIATNLALEHLHGRKATMFQPSQVASSKDLARWAPKLVEEIAKAIKAWAGRWGVEGDEAICLDEEHELHRLSKNVREEWQIHLQRDHYPFRQDCRECIKFLANGRSHRAVSHPFPFVLHLDICGPMRVKGRSIFGANHKYLLVGAFRYPNIAQTPPPDPEEGEDPALVGLFEEKEDKRVQEDEVAKPPANPEAPEQEDAADRELQELREPFEYDVAYFTKPLKSRIASEVLTRVQEICAEVKLMGFPILKIHSDRAKELSSTPFRAWMSSQGIVRSATEGEDPAANGVAEAAVKFVKGRTRILIQMLANQIGEEKAKSFWPLAAHTAAVQQRMRRCLRPWPSIAAFGSKVLIKTKHYGVSKSNDLAPKWIEGHYLGPSPDVTNGHVVWTKKGNLWQTTSLRTPRDPEPEAEMSVHEENVLTPLPQPRRRLTSKTTLSGIWVEPELTTMCGLEGSEEEAELQALATVGSKEGIGGKAKKLEDIMEDERLCKEYFSQARFSREDAVQLLNAMPIGSEMVNQRRGTHESSLVIGAYSFGGTQGVTATMAKRPWLARYLNVFMKLQLQTHLESEGNWSAMILLRGKDVPTHKDYRNHPNTYNHVIALGEEGRLWLEGEEEENPHVGGTDQKPELRSNDRGEAVLGRTTSITQRPAIFNPRHRHAFTSSTGAWVISCYTPMGLNRLKDEEVQQLLSLGFPLPLTMEQEIRPDKEAAGGWTERIGVPQGFVEMKVDWKLTHVDENDAQPRECAPKLQAMSMRALKEDAVICEKEDEHVEDMVQRQYRAAAMRLELEAQKEAFGKWEQEGVVPSGDLLNGVTQEADSLEERLLDVERRFQQSLKQLQALANPPSEEEPSDVPGGVEAILESLVTPLQVVYTLPLDEVKQHLSKWVKAIQKEINALVDMGALRALSLEEQHRLKRDGLLCVLPAKGVFTAKPPDEPQTLYKRKARVVICGNYQEKQDKEDVYATGCASESLRTVLAWTASKDEDVGGTDIRNAFLLAPMPKEEVVYAIRTPTVVKEAFALIGVLLPEVYAVERALYGFRRSPKLWNNFRNEELSKAKIEIAGRTAVLKQLVSDENIWAVVWEDKLLQCPHASPAQLAISFIVVYVDDLLYLGRKYIIKGIHKWVAEKWKCNDLEFATESSPIRFLGLEIYRSAKGIRITQEGYVTEVIRQHGLEEARVVSTPCPKEWLLGPDLEEGSEEFDARQLHAAQKVTGELLWIATKTRPDIIHQVATMCALVSRRPIFVERLGTRVIQYLAGTRKYGLSYKVGANCMRVVAFSDASYGPSGGRSIGCTVATVGEQPVAWRASRQPTVALSVAEAELTEVFHAAQQLEGIAVYIEEFSGKRAEREILVDNCAAIALSNQAPGCWRSRHLKIKAQYLRQQTSEGNLTIRHIPGTLQLADLGTKCFSLARLRELVRLWGLMPEEEQGAQPKPLDASMARLVYMGILLGAPTTVLGKVKEPLPLEYPWEFYVLVILGCAGMLMVWEAIKWLCYRWWHSEQVWLARERRVERLRRKAARAVEDELRAWKEGAEVEEELPPPTRLSRIQQSEEQASSSTSALGNRPTMVDKQTQATPAIRPCDPPPRQIEIQMQQVLHDGPYFLTDGGDAIHTSRACWGLRNASRVNQRMLCRCCRDNGGESLYDRTPGTSRALRQADTF